MGSNEDFEVLYPDYFKELQDTIGRFWNNYVRLGGHDMGWFSKNIGPLMSLPSCAGGKVTYEYRDENNNWLTG